MNDTASPFWSHNALKRTDAKEIAQALTILADMGRSLHFYSGAEQLPAVAPLTEVDAAGRCFQLDCTHSPRALAVLAQRTPKLCVGLSDGFKIEFCIEEAVHAGPDAGAVLTLPFPEELYQIERRAFLRLDPPIGRPYQARFVHQYEDYVLAIQDLSVGGVALRTDPESAPQVRPGASLKQVHLQLGIGRGMKVDLEVKLCRTFRSRLIGEQLHIGCQFVNLSPAQQHELLRIMDALEKERRGVWA